MKLPHKIIIFLVSGALALAGAEFLARRLFRQDAQYTEVTFKGNLVQGEEAFFKISDDPVLVYEWKELPFSRAVTPAKPKGVFRIIVLGDSVTNPHLKGWQIIDYYPQFLEGLLQKYPGRCEVINAGTPGYNTVQEVRYLERRWLAYAPDMVIVGYCAGNDRVVQRRIMKYGDGVYCSDTRESVPYIRVLSPAVNNFLMRSSAFYRALQALGVSAARDLGVSALEERVAAYDISFETENAVKRIKKLAADNGFGLVFVIFPFMGEGLPEETEWIIDKCEKYGIAYIDMRPFFREAGHDYVRLEPGDNYHLSRFGHRITAEAIEDSLRKNFTALWKIKEF